MDDYPLQFPVLCLSQDSSIAVAETAERLHRCNALAFFKNRYYDNLVVIDSRGSRFQVARADVVPALSTLGRWTARLLNRQLRVALQLEARGPAGLDETREMVAKWIDRAPDFWEASRDIEEWRRMIARARTVRELIGLFSSDP